MDSSGNSSDVTVEEDGERFGVDDLDLIIPALVKECL